MPGDMPSYIRKLEPGKAFFIREKIDEGPWEISWVIKESAVVLRKLGKPQIEFRAALLWIEDVAIISVLVRVRDRIYETWLNQHADTEFLRTLAKQERVLMHFYAGQDAVPRRSIFISNPLGEFAAQALATPGPETTTTVT